MKKVAFAIVGAAALALAACGGKNDNEDDMTANSEQVMDNGMDMNAVANNTAAPTETANKADEATDDKAKDDVPVDDSDANAAEVQAM